MSKLTEIKDYSSQLNELKELITKNAEQDKSISLQEKISQQATATQNLTAAVKQIIQRQEALFKDFPNELKVKLLHRFEDNNKGFIICGVILVAISALLTGICLHLWSDNGKMKDNDVKFRMVRQMVPNIAYRADTMYYSDPEAMEKKTKKLEAQQLALAKAEEVARKTEQEATRAKKEAEKLKRSNNNIN